MHREKAILLTIRTERSMEPTLKELVERAGARGYTIGDDASGWGKHGHRTGQFESDQSFKMLLIVSKSVAQFILQQIERKLQPEYAMTAVQHQIEVIDLAAFVRPPGIALAVNDCLTFHGGPAGELDIAGYRKKGAEEDDLAGAMRMSTSGTRIIPDGYEREERFTCTWKKRAC